MSIDELLKQALAETEKSVSVVVRGCTIEVKKLTMSGFNAVRKSLGDKPDELELNAAMLCKCAPALNIEQARKIADCSPAFYREITDAVFTAAGVNAIVEQSKKNSETTSYDMR